MTIFDGNVRRMGFALPVVAVLALGAADAMAQEKRKVSFNSPAASTKYTQQNAIDVGDVPGHQIRVFEIQRTYGTDAPVIEGLRLKESWSRGLTDFNDLNGLGVSYNIYVLENGDRIFARGHFIAQSVASEGSLRNLAASTLTGGTGKFSGIRGVVRTETSANPKAGMNEQKGEMEYWLPK
jgi:hypothetical protein